MALSLGTADAALKEDYQPTIREQLNTAYMLLSQIEKNSRDTEGRRAVLSLHVSRNTGVGARAENAALPPAGNQGYVEERVPLKYNYGRIQISGPVIRAMKSDSGSFTRAVDSESRGIVQDLKRDVNRQLWGTADGVIAATGVTTASTTVVLSATITPAQLRQLDVGMVISIGTAASPYSVSGTARTIVSINRTAKTMVVSGAAVTTATTDRIFRDLAGGSSPQIELTGVQKIVDNTGTLFNVDPAVNDVWKSTVLNNAAAPGTPVTVTDTRLATLLDETGIASGQGPGSLLVSSYGVVRNYAATLTSLKRFNDTVDLKGGWKGVEVSSSSGTAVFTADLDAPSNKVFLLSTPNLTFFEESDWEFMDEDGAVLSRVSGVDAYEATLFKYAELATDKRNAHARMDDALES